MTNICQYINLDALIIAKQKSRTKVSTLCLMYSTHIANVYIEIKRKINSHLE